MFVGVCLKGVLWVGGGGGGEIPSTYCVHKIVHEYNECPSQQQGTDTQASISYFDATLPSIKNIDLTVKG